MRTLGIDLASDPRKTACCLLEWRAGAADLRELVIDTDDDRLLELQGHADVTGIDCPFGWPTAFLAFLCAASRPTGEPMPGWSREHRDGLRFRVTDFRVREVTGRWPLSVSSDLIAVAALRCQGLLTRMGVTDRSGDGRVYEVYPAAALKVWGLVSKGYKGSHGRPQREALVAQLLERAEWLTVDQEVREQLASSDDAVDAMIASLNARAAKLGLTIRPEADEHRDAVREGWIAIPEKGSLEKLLGPAVPAA
jgi:predicted nuclease with RNAse H fold